MKYMVGYRIENGSFVESIIKNKQHIYEVYFSYGNFANGRNSQLNNTEYTQIEAFYKQNEDLKKLTENGIPLNLLFNGNCYGRKSQSRSLFNRIGETVDYIESNYCLQSVTTTSPLIAKFIKNNFEQLEIRASVNMKIGTTEGMDYLADYFDSFYMQREYNRDIERIKQLKSYCDENNKKLYALANSGCLNNCSAQTFHDNLVSHETEISTMDNAYNFVGICREYLKDEKHLTALITNTNFIRPEDIALYEQYFTAMKLATRVSPNPETIMNSYINGKYSGNILDILEPRHSIYPYVLENSEKLTLKKLEDELCLQVK